ncbi:MAG: putative quinol monooxygenase [Pseudomonadota bacterium]
MFVIFVQFEIKSADAAAFLPLMLENAARSLSEEPGCQQFDVCQDPKMPERVFLYEVYDNEAAFQDHLKSAHFKAFDAATAPMIASKTVQSFERLAP